MSMASVSVLMTVYNGGAYLETAVASILAQSLTDFEFLIVDDGSTDGSLDAVEALRDPRIRLIRAPHGGLVKALNLGLSQARGRYLARMDADDVAHPDRLELQVAYLDAHPGIGVVYSNVTVIDGAGREIGRQIESNLSASVLREGLLYRRKMKPIVHPSVMMRREVFETLGGYRELTGAEDRDFWLRASAPDMGFCFARLEPCLLSYRIHAGGISRAKGSLQRVSSAMAVLTCLVRGMTGIDIFDSRPELFAATAEALRLRLEAEVVDAALAFRSSRDDLHAGRWMRGALGMAWALLRYRTGSLPDGARSRTRRIIDEVAAGVVRELARTSVSLTADQLSGANREAETVWTT